MYLGAGTTRVPQKLSNRGRYAYGGAPYSRDAVPAPTPTSVPGTYGGPPGSFITRSSCPPGYNPVALSRGDIRCVPIPQAPAAPSMPMPDITVSPTFQQQFTPQFSPVLQQQQDSPGGAQAAQPSQTSTAPQSTVPAATVPTAIPLPITAPVTSPAPFSLPARESVPVSIPRQITAPSSIQEKPIEKEKENYMPLILGGVGLLLLMMNKTRKK